MKNTMTLLEMALNKEPATYWTKKLELSRSAIHMAKMRGNLSPAIAGALAAEMGEDPKEWIVVAALESERESACKTRMMRALVTGATLSLGAVGTAAAKAICILC